MLTGFFTLQPNEARVLLLFGAYKGTVRKSGFHWANPFYSRDLKGGGVLSPVSAKSGRDKVSLRARTLNVVKLKVNDKRGNPDRNRRRRGLARGGHRPGGLRRGRL